MKDCSKHNPVLLVPSCPPLDTQRTWFSWRRDLLPRLTLVPFLYIYFLTDSIWFASTSMGAHESSLLVCTLFFFFFFFRNVAKLCICHSAIVQLCSVYSIKDSKRRTRYRGRAPELYAALITHPSSSPYMHRLLGDEFFGAVVVVVGFWGFF